MSAFTEVPILDLSLAQDPSTKPSFLSDLKRALLEVGFLYIKNFGIDSALTEDVIRLGKQFFELPEEEKLRIEMKNSPHFLGYSRLGNELTAHNTDWREQIDLGTELPAPSPSEPRYRQLRGPNMWPSEDLIPGFRKSFETYIEEMGKVSEEFTSLVAETLGMPRDAFEKYYHGIGESKSGTKRQDKLKIVKYPDLGDLGEGRGSGQGVGPHKDSMLSSYLLQIPPHRSLEVQNSKGDWIPCPPIDGTLVVALGQGLEAITGGVVTSTTHRVVSPAAGEGPRYSIPFFQGISYDAEFELMDVPEEVRALKKKVLAQVEGHEEVEMTFRRDLWGRLGEATLWNRVKSHQDVGEAFYPDLLAQVRASVAVEKEKKDKETEASSSSSTLQVADPKPQGRRRAPTIVLDRVDDGPSFGEDPGPDGSLERKEAFEKRKMDSTPDKVRMVDNSGNEDGYFHEKKMD